MRASLIHISDSVQTIFGLVLSATDLPQVLPSFSLRFRFYVSITKIITQSMTPSLTSHKQVKSFKSENLSYITRIAIACQNFNILKAGYHVNTTLIGDDFNCAIDELTDPG